MSKSLLNAYHITKILFPLYEIVVAEHDDDGIFQTGNSINALKKSPNHGENVNL